MLWLAVAGREESPFETCPAPRAYHGSGGLRVRHKPSPAIGLLNVSTNLASMRVPAEPATKVVAGS